MCIHIGPIGASLFDLCPFLRKSFRLAMQTIMLYVVLALATINRKCVLY